VALISRGADLLDLEDPADFHFVLEVQMQIGEEVAEERVGGQTVG
jgi:hypothetical protein